MAILHQATLSPTKLEFVTDWLDDMGFGTGPVTLVGGYRFDDPEGKVGVEGLIARRGDEYFQLPVTYRDAPLEVGSAHLVTTMQHSVLGKRWVYGASGDPVAVEEVRDRARRRKPLPGQRDILLDAVPRAVAEVGPGDQRGEHVMAASALRVEHAVGPELEERGARDRPFLQRPRRDDEERPRSRRSPREPPCRRHASLHGGAGSGETGAGVPLRWTVAA